MRRIEDLPECDHPDHICMCSWETVDLQTFDIAQKRYEEDESWQPSSQRSAFDETYLAIIEAERLEYERRTREHHAQMLPLMISDLHDIAEDTK